MPRRRVARVPRLQRVLVDHVPTQRWRLPLARSQVGIPQAAGRWRERVIQQRLLLNPRPGLQRSLRRFPTALQRSRRLRSIPPRSRADHFASGYRKTAAAVPMPARRSSAGRPPTGPHVPRSIVSTMEKLSFASLPVWSLYAHSGRCRPAAAPPKWVPTAATLELGPRYDSLAQLAAGSRPLSKEGGRPESKVRLEVGSCAALPLCAVAVV